MVEKRKTDVKRFTKENENELNALRESGKVINEIVCKNYILVLFYKD